MRSKAIYTLLPTLLFLLLLSASLTIAADALHPKSKIPNTFRLDKAPKFNLVGHDRGGSSYDKGAGEMNLRLDDPPVPLSPGNIAGFTTYDYQHNGSMGNQIAFSYANNYVHMCWMAQTRFVIGPQLGGGDRHIRYQLYDAPSENYIMPPSGQKATEAYSGYANVAVMPGGGGGVGCHVDPASSGYFYSAIFYDAVPGLGLFTDSDVGSFDHEWQITPSDPETMEHLWPIVNFHNDDSANVTDDVAYILSHSYNTEQLHLYRRVGIIADLEPGEPQTWGSWDHQVIDEVVTDLSYIITADVNSDRVAIVYTDDRTGEVEGSGGQRDLDVYYKLSTNQGVDWGDQINISNYDENDSLWRGYSDLDGMFTSDGELHIIWAAREIQNKDLYYSWRCRLIHWSTDVPQQGIVDEARYDMKLGDDFCDADAWNMYIAKMSISECDGKLYAIYTKFGDARDSDALRDCSQGGFANGELYQAGSDDFGQTWDTAVNLTRTRNQVPGVGCDSNECESDHWSTTAEFGMVYAGAEDSLDVIYINDRDAGGIPQGSGTWTNNNVMHLRIACREIIHLPKVSLEPNEIDDPAHIAPGIDTSFVMKLSNIGNEVMNVSSIDAAYVDGSGWLTIGAYDAVIPAGGFTFVDITIGPIAGPDPSGWHGYILVNTDAPTGQDTIPVAIIVASDFNLPQYDTLQTTTKALLVSNTGNIGRDGVDSLAFNIPGDCDDTLSSPNGDMYLYDMTPVIAWNDGSENLTYTTIFTQSFTDEKGTFRPQSEMTMTAEAGYNLAICTVSTVDSLYGIAITLYAPTDGPDFIVGQYDYFAWNPIKLATDVYVGALIDWDIPADKSVDNGSGFDTLTQSIWQYGAEIDDTDEVAGCDILESDRFGGMRQLTGTTFGAWTNENAPMQTGSAFDADSLFSHMSNQSWYNSITVDTANHDSELVDLHAGMTFGKVDLSGGQVYSFVWAIATSNTASAKSGDDMHAQLEAARLWADAHDLLVKPCTCYPGDANGDLGVNVGDAVYIINYVFKGGPAPTPYGVCSGDANGDCGTNVGDAVYVINYVFKGGTPPVNCEEWRDGHDGNPSGCGEPQ